MAPKQGSKHIAENGDGVFWNWIVRQRETLTQSVPVVYNKAAEEAVNTRVIIVRCVGKPALGLCPTMLTSSGSDKER